MANLERTIRYLNRFAAELTALIRENIIEYDLLSSYNLYNSIDVHIVNEHPSGARSRLNVVLNLEDYWQIIENGRRPGKRFPPLDDIRHWIQIKPIMPREDNTGKIPTEDQLTFLIGRKIARDGTEPKPFVSDSVEEMLQSFYLDIQSELESDLADDLEQIILGAFRNKDFKTINIR